MEKSADAFRTISEVAEDLVLPQHVLRFWETRFPQIRPLKRAGGRRYYRPADIILLRSIRQLLYDEGYTIKGVQRLLREQGARGLRMSEPSVAVFPSEPEASAEEVAAYEVLDAGAGGPEPSPALGVAEAGVDRVTETSLNRDGLREALACIEECERILLALRHPTS